MTVACLRLDRVVPRIASNRSNGYVWLRSRVAILAANSLRCLELCWKRGDACRYLRSIDLKICHDTKPTWKLYTGGSLWQQIREWVKRPSTPKDLTKPTKIVFITRQIPQHLTHGHSFCPGWATGVTDLDLARASLLLRPPMWIPMSMACWVSMLSAWNPNDFTALSRYQKSSKIPCINVGWFKGPLMQKADEALGTAGTAHLRHSIFEASVGRRAEVPFDSNVPPSIWHVI